MSSSTHKIDSSDSSYDQRLCLNATPSRDSTRLPYPFKARPSTFKAAILAGTASSRQPEAFSSRWDDTVVMWAKRDSVDGVPRPATLFNKRDRKTDATENLEKESETPTALIDENSANQSSDLKALQKPLGQYGPSKGLENFPGELRNTLYRASFVAPLSKTPAFTEDATNPTPVWTHIPPPLATAFPHLRPEILSLYYSENNFHFTRSMNAIPSLLTHFATSIGTPNLQHLRRVTLTHGVHYSSALENPPADNYFHHDFVDTTFTLHPQTGMVVASLHHADDDDGEEGFCTCRFLQHCKRENAVTMSQAFRRSGENALVHHVQKLLELMQVQELAFERKTARPTTQSCSGCGGGRSYWCSVGGVERVVQDWAPSEVWGRLC